MSNSQNQFQDKKNHKELFNNDTNKSYQQSQQSDIAPQKTKKRKLSFNKQLKMTGLVLMGLFIVSIPFLTSVSEVDVSDTAKQALQNRVSTQLAIGTLALKKDEPLEAQDLTVKHSSSQEKTKVHIWDYAAEDGDYVQVLVNGVAIGDPFMIKNKPVVVEVPATGEVQILGTRDGGGGITYAVHYEINGTTYFNGMDPGKGNRYTLIRE